MKVKVSLEGPSPVPGEAVKKVVPGEGAVDPAGTVSAGEYETVLTGSEQLPVPAVREESPVMADADVGRVCPDEVVNVVEVIARFHPLPVPVSSLVLSAILPDEDSLDPLSVTLGRLIDVGEAERESEPPEQPVPNCATNGAPAPVSPTSQQYEADVQNG